MNMDFPRVLTLLRKEKKISQKQAAEDLKLNQALLSHYEKGKRECGLAFLVRAADYYNVSADYLLGRTAARDGSVIAKEDLVPKDVKADRELGSFSTAMSKRIIISGLDIVFSLAARIKNQTLTASIIRILNLAVYRVFRLLHAANPAHTSEMFAQSLDMALRFASAHSDISEAAALDSFTENKSNIEISTHTIEQEYQKQGTALLSLIKGAQT
ncbi:MAG: helix-turn-helix transcriptional regulator [Oscillospiraceae bacterium]|nr:helix-turn-helix transcriptional regulator [Oscillospiraceae bacterium]